MQLITEEEIRNLARIARVAITDDECASLARDVSVLSELTAVLGSVSLKQTNTEQSRRLSDLREDITGEVLPREVLLSKAPLQDGESILVPRAVEE